MTPFAVSREELPDRIVIRVTGEVDMATAGQLLGALAPDSGRPFVIDLTDTTFMDSSGLAALAIAHKRGDPIVLRNPSATVRKILTISGLDQALDLEG
jgi:anti-anti-sigma factor